MSNNREPYAPQPFSKDRNINTGDDKSNNRAGAKINHGLFCYNCKEKGHPFSRCPKPLVKCSHCNKIGHKAELCHSKLNTGSTKADTVAKTMRISNTKPCNKFIKEVIVEGVPLEAFIDLGSEVTLIAQSRFTKLGLTHDHTPSSMKGFGNHLVCSMGSAKLNLSIDGVDAIVLCRVVEDRFLEKHLLVGQSFTEQPHIVVYKDVNRLQFIHVDTEMPIDVQDEDDDRLEKIRILAYCKLYGTASVRAMTETLFTGSVIVDTKVVGQARDADIFVSWPDTTQSVFTRIQ
ncbi:Uncharacterized protein OBRU01_16071 [Operophtera brumata]|uniref:CCHC-type domain-containing protein n=1 Tax=Operophtera brumata TaxID=104452 RepID=A0A0L7L3H8_OPEBR|nr:Uncharacterized protein OBRU01_16071 [Operophtera brumata]